MAASIRAPENSRGCAARVLAAVFSGRSLTDALQLPCVAASDAPFVQALCYGVLRDYPRHRLLVDHLLKQPLKAADRDIDALLQCALYQIERMRVPPHAAVNESVQGARQLRKPWATRLVNGLLRRYLRETAQCQAWLAADETALHGLPAWLLGLLRQAWPQHWPEIARALAAQGPLTLRVNRLRGDPESYLGLLNLQGLAASPHPCAPEALTLEQAVPVERLPGFGEGLVSVQDAGAQLAARLLQPRPGERVLDACAAPGGKTGHLLELAGGDLRLTALDLDPQRLQRVQDNLRRLGLAADCQVGDATAPAGDWARLRYQKILLDAPCTATGVIRRHPDIKLLRRPEDLAPVVAVQQAALHALWPLLEPGGRLLYATCSLLPEENQLQVARFLANHPDARDCPVSAGWGQPLQPGRQTLPGEAGMDGFYYALLKKGTP